MTRSRLLFAVLVAGLMAVTACGGASDSTTGSSSSDKGSKSLSLVAYSTPEVVYDEIEPLFQKTGDGEGVGFKSSFGASGEQSRAVEAGLKADVVSFSLEPDMDRLVKAGLVDSNWADTPSKGLVTTSLVSFIVRKGNPKGIKTWDDLLKPGVQVLTPNPFTSGAAKWNLLGAYGAKSDGGKNPQAGLDVPEGAHHQARQGPGQVRPRRAEHLHQRHRRRAALLRVRGDHRAEEGPGRRLRHARPTRSRSRTRSP